MKAYEFSTTITSDGKLDLPNYLKNLPKQPRVRVIVLVEESLDIDLEDQDEVFDPSPEQIAASIYRSLHEVKKGQTKPISEFWDSLDGN